MGQGEKDSADNLVAPSDDRNELQVEDLRVKERCFEQREALPGEPRCAICGRYGEYICDQTDDDICSLECKTALLARIASETKIPVKAPARVKVPFADESFCVRDNNFPDIPSLHASQIASLRNKLDICVKGEAVPDPITCFSSCGLPEKLVHNLEAAGYTMPTPVQMQVIPASISNRSLLVSADTGSGKTASFLVPIIAHCSRRELQQCARKRGPLAIVLAPTRELCLQVEDQAKVLGKGLPFKTALVIGGDPLAQQIYRIENGVELIVGTPGRLIDLLMKHSVDLTDVSVFVLDEVDCLLERGFRDQAMQIFRALSCPQVMMFSATIHSEIEKLSNSLSNNMIHISCGSPGKPNKSVRQVVIWVESKQKKQKIFEIIKRVLGRGMDLLKVHQVILFDMPNSIDEYIHQVGRASRMGKEGVAIAFVNEEDRKLFGELAQVLKTAGAPIPRELSNSKFTSSISLGTDRKRKLSSRARS
ncbi:hypothetical protein ZWY2020_025633 [Hordeum vulgare]|nr:hypothetical protein ZWY2020_025633 [Hordeum vulgare]